VEAFSDGVIAIAITLLILDVRVPPESSTEDPWAAVLGQWGAFAAYALSFAAIGIMWVSHHRLMHGVRSVDRALLYLNLVLLAGIAFLPYPTALLSRALADPRYAGVAVVFYSGTMVLVSSMFVVIWFHLARRPDLLHGGDATAEIARRRGRAGLVGPVLYAVMAPLAWLSPVAMLVGYAAVAIFYASRPFEGAQNVAEASA
jgi:uncharacterized membrane protein